MAFLIGTLIGAALGLAIDRDAWLAGAIIGGVVGWLVGRKRGVDADDRHGALEQRLAALEQRLDRFDARLVGLEAGRTPEAAPAPPVAAAPESAQRAVLEPAPEVPPMAPVPVMPPPLPAAEAITAAPPTPPSRGLEDSAIWRWLTGGNTVVRVGVIVLFFGVAFLLRYAYEHVHAPIELRLAGVAAGAVALLGFGWRLRERRAGYALALQGGGIGVLYLVIFAAFKLYQLIPPAPAFALLVGVAAFSAVLAVVQDSRSLAVLGVSGGFLAPILASTGGGSHVMLFSYYAVLNAGILGIAWFKAWRILNLVGFGFTFAIGTVWGVQLYQPGHFSSTEPFLVLFFLFYVAIPLAFARRQAGRLERYVDATLVFGVPLVAFGLQVGLVRDIEYGAAWSALALAAFYLVLARTIWGRSGERLRLLAESFLALGVVFATLAIPLALEGRWTSAAWALEGAAIVWVGVRQQRLAARVFGLALQFLAGLAFLADATRVPGQLAVANSFYLGCLFLALGGLFCAWYLDRHRDAVTRGERIAAHVLFGWGIAWWVFGGLHEIRYHVLRPYRAQGALLFLTGSCVAFSRLHTRIDWRAARYAALAQLPLMIGPAVAAAVTVAHPLARIGWIAWPLAFAAHFFVLRRHERSGSRYQYWLHAAGLWLFAALASWEVAWAIDELVRGKAVWPLIAWALVPGALLALLALHGARIGWPVAAHRDAYLVAGCAPLAVFLALWAFLVNFVSNGDPSPLPYVPVLNPLDLAVIGAVIVIALWFSEGRKLGIPAFATASPAPAYALGAAAAFVWLNAVLLRTLHHWAGVPFDFERMLRSDLVQASFSILWTLIALATMVFATRRGWRTAWIAGGALLLVVVAKLFVVDLSNIGTIARIVSFMGVGVLMLVVGYFSPVPPKAREEAR